VPRLCRSGDLPWLFGKRRIHNAARTRILPDGFRLSARHGADSSQWLQVYLHAGAGLEGDDRCWLEIHTPAYLDGHRAAALLTELSGREFRYSWHHI